jgi:hypothetical protein
VLEVQQDGTYAAIVVIEGHHRDLQGSDGLSFERS